MLRLLFTTHNTELLFALPFIGVLLSVAFGSTIFPKHWHQHYFKIALGWVFACLLSLFWHFKSISVIWALQHTILHDYVPFIILIGTLFIITSGIHLKIADNGTPFANVVVLGFGGILASIIGTTGASMLLIRPLLRLNSSRAKKSHIVIFFIFIVANIGGVLTPLGDPPLFLGYLNGISFTWSIIIYFSRF